MVSMTEANQNFSKTEDEFDEAVSDAEVLDISKQFIEKYRNAYEILSDFG